MCHKEIVRVKRDNECLISSCPFSLALTAPGALLPLPRFSGVTQLIVSRAIEVHVGVDGHVLKRRAVKGRLKNLVLILTGEAARQTGLEFAHEERLGFLAPPLVP